MLSWRNLRSKSEGKRFHEVNFCCLCLQEQVATKHWKETIWRANNLKLAKNTMFKQSNKQQLQQVFAQDPVLYSYHLGDMDELFFANCTFFQLQEQIVLFYESKNLAKPVLLALGTNTENMTELITQVLQQLPNGAQFFCHYLQPYLSVFLQYCTQQYQDLGKHNKMLLQVLPFVGSKDANRAVQCLDQAKLLQFYEEHYPENYFDTNMVQTKTYYVIQNEQGEILAAAGTHVYSQDYKIAVLGNVAVHKQHRRKGLGSACVSQCIASILERGTETVCLNVMSNNSDAIQMYSKLGFVIVHTYEEALFGK